MLRTVILVLALLGATNHATAGLMTYEVVDRFDFFKLNPDGSPALDPGGNLIPGEPLDKGFAVTGTMDAVGLGLYGQDADPFQSWNITETVLNSDGSTTDYIFNEGNSVWKLDQSPNVGLGVVRVDPFNILLLQAFIATTPPTQGENTLFLESTALDQRLFWFVPESGSGSFFASQKISTGEFNGIYLTGSGGNLEIARISAVPVPAPLGLLAAGMILLGCVGVRRGGRA